MNRSPLSETTVQAIAIPARRAVWKYVGGLAPVVILWGILVVWLAMVLMARANWSENADRAAIREWLDEARNFRKTLPELVKEYVRLRDDDPNGTSDPKRLEIKRTEIAEHMRSLAEPTRAYVNQLPLFPEIYRIQIDLAAANRKPTDGDSIEWVSTVPRPARQKEGQIRLLEYEPLGKDDRRAIIRCEYRVHAFNKLQQQYEDSRRESFVAGALLLTATALATLFVYRFLMRERHREVARLTAVAEKEHRELELLQSLWKQDEAEKARRELKGKLLQQQLETADLSRRTAEAEKAALEMKSQLYASIGIMAGSYAHNIKNLLVRPNDLLVRCIDANGLSGEQEGMLHEVRSTLGTVTERLQQILRTVSRNPGNAEVARIDLNPLILATVQTWSEMAWDKWKVRIVANIEPGSLEIDGDLSHLQQTIENLIFNARDATFEMRNHLREIARKENAIDPIIRKQRLIEAASWKGEITLSTRRTTGNAVLEVTDNGIGMTEAVKANCLRTHFTTKRDNALYEGYSAGMGLGLSFVAVVLEHHHATLEIESEPLKGASFRVEFPMPTAK